MTPKDINGSGTSDQPAKPWRGIDWDGLPHGGNLFGEMHLDDLAKSGAGARPLLWPGLALCSVAAATAAWLSEHYGFPIMLLGLLVGLSLNFVTRDARTHPGLDFASRTCLRLGIVVLGLQVTIAQVTALGLAPFGALLVVIVSTFLAGIVGARLIGLTRYLGILAGGATAICGASAALAIYGVIGKDRLNQAQFALTLVGVSLASALAMSVYPALAGMLALNDRQAGFLIGASIHDVSQAIGGGYAFSDAAGSYATIVKLTRVALLAPVVAVVSLLLGPASELAGQPLWRRLALPWFIAAFLAMVVLNSMVHIPAQIGAYSLATSKALLVLAVTATAMRSRMELLMEMGWRATVPVLAASLVSFAVSLAFAVTIL
jgi:uncharacterized integral membrane protein (TIGR00698 family)